MIKVLELFAGSRSIGKAAEQLGYEVFSVDWEKFDDIDLSIDIEDLKLSDVPFTPDVIWASPDCKSYSISAISHHRRNGQPHSDYAKKSDRVNKHFLGLIKQWKELNPGLIYFIENPRGMMRKMEWMQEYPRHTVTYCLGYNTEIITKNGIFKIGDVENTIQTLLTEGGEWVPAPIKNYGKQKLTKITLSRSGKKKFIYATPNHKWFTNKGILETQYLENGIKLDYVKMKKPDCEIIDEYVARGFTYGDGWNLKTKSKGFVMFCDEKKEMLPYFNNIGGKRWDDDTETNTITKLYGTPIEWKTEMLSMDNDPSEIYSWLAGYLAADGTVHKNNSQVSISSSKKEDLIHLRNLCRIIGIGTYSIVEYLRKGYGKKPTLLYQMTFMRSDILTDLILRKKHKINFEKNGTPKHQARRWVVKNIEITERCEDVYCAEVPITHSFALEDDILTHNCQYGDSRMKPTDIWTNSSTWIPRPMCKNGDTCHTAAPRGSKTGTQGYKNAYERSKIPHDLCYEIMSSVK